MKMNTNKSFDHIGIITSNYRRLVNFYSRMLGFKIMKEEKLSASVMRSVFGLTSEGVFTRLVSGKVRIEIFCITSGVLKKKTNATIGYHHWAMHVGDKNKFIEKLIKKRVRIIHIKRNNHSIYFIPDPDGNRIEIKD
jgi:catechol 2,3-dioxygenase-like lactoylglutathione lyase family enzyme